MEIFLSAFDMVPDARAINARHNLGELLVIVKSSCNRRPAHLREVVFLCVAQMVLGRAMPF